MVGKVAFITFIGPKKLVSKFRFISSSGISSIGPVIPAPALFIRTSIRFSCFKTSAIQVEIVSDFVTSKATIGNLLFG